MPFPPIENIFSVAFWSLGILSIAFLFFVLSKLNHRICEFSQLKKEFNWAFKAGIALMIAVAILRFFALFYYNPVITDPAELESLLLLKIILNALFAVAGTLAFATAYYYWGWIKH